MTDIYDDLRPVMIHEHYLLGWNNNVFVPEQSGLFHCWAGTSERAYALIELRDGSIMSVTENNFHFTDRFWNTAWMRAAPEKKENK